MMRGRWQDRIGPAWLGHESAKVAVAAVVGLWAIVAAVVAARAEPGRPVWGACAVLTVVGLIAQVAGTAHNAVLCGRCAAAMPLDAPAAAAARRRTLRAYHALGSKAAGVVVLGLVAAVFLVNVFSSGRTALAPIPLGLTWVAAMAVLQAAHRQLQPWCPFCHRDDGGDWEPPREPDPPGGCAAHPPRPRHVAS